MVPGDSVPENTILSVPKLYNRGNAPLTLFVNYEMVFHAIIADAYNNKINQYRETDSLEFSIPQLNQLQYKSSVYNF